jgi:uroporphyrinogen-III synthase
VSELLVITRVDPRDDALASEAKGRGGSVLRLPLLETLPGGDGEAFLEWLESRPEGAAVAWTSRRAAEGLVALVGSRARGALSRIPLFALGAESAAPARDAGLPVETPPNGGGAAALAEWIAGKHADRKISSVAFLHGDKALPALPDGLRRAGLGVASFELYRTRYLSPDVRALRSALEAGGNVRVAFFSPSGVDALERLLPPESLAALRGSAHVLSRGETTHGTLISRGYRRAARPGSFFESFDPAEPGALQSEKRKSR